MVTSVRLRLIDWLQRVADKASQGVPEALGHDEAHSKPMGDDDLALVCPVCGRAPERKVDDAAICSVLRHHIDECRNEAGVHDVDIATAKSLAALNNHYAAFDAVGFVAHIKNLPQSGNSIDLSKVNAKIWGVE